MVYGDKVGDAFETPDTGRSRVTGTGQVSPMTALGKIGTVKSPGQAGSERAVGQVPAHA
jgi:hypothetical protein